MTYSGSGSAKEWKTTSKWSMQRKKRRREREERRQARMTRRASGKKMKVRDFAVEEAPVYKEIVKKLLSSQSELKEMGSFTTVSLATKFEFDKNKTTHIVRVFLGLKIVKEVCNFFSRKKSFLH